MGPGAQHRNRQHPPTKPQDSLVVLVGVELAVPAGEGVATLAKQHKGLVLVHVAIHRALTVPRLGWSWGMGSMKRELILTTSSSRSGQRSGPHFLSCNPGLSAGRTQRAYSSGQGGAEILALKTLCPQPDREGHTPLLSASGGDSLT